VADPSETTQVSPEAREPEASELLGAVRALSVQVGGLQAELQSLRAQVHPLPEAPDAPGWDESAPARRESSPWVRSLDRPGPRGPAVPRLLIEVVFLVAVALGSAIAELDPVVIVLLMASAWALVAVAEWIAARAAQRHAHVLEAPLAGAGGYFAEDPSWFGPPVERAVVEAGTDAEDTATRLPQSSHD
jgi:hypothetical protein